MQNLVLMEPWIRWGLAIQADPVSVATDTTLIVMGSQNFNRIRATREWYATGLHAKALKAQRRKADFAGADGSDRSGRAGETTLCVVVTHLRIGHGPLGRSGRSQP